MGKWKQVSGDMTWDRHGVVFAKVEVKPRQVQLVRIEPWIEHDREAAITHGLYLVDAKTVDYDDLSVAHRDVRGALDASGMDVADYKKLPPEHKAELLASSAGYEESRSVDKLQAALPAPVEQIEFWGGPETAEKLATYDQDMRREVLEANFETRLSFGELPDLQAIEFAMGGEAFDMELQGQDELAFDYATAVSGVSGTTDTPERFARTVRALAEAPDSEGLDFETLRPGLRETLLAWERRYGDSAGEDEGIASTAHALASSMLSVLGFEWV